MNWTPQLDEDGGVKGGFHSHPLSEPHPLNSGYHGRKERSLAAQGVSARNDVHIQHAGKGMPWADLHLYMPEHPDVSVKHELTPHKFGRTQTPVSWQVLDAAPDESRYAWRNEGRLGHAINAYFSYVKE